MTVAQDYVAVVERLAAERQTAMNTAVVAPFDEDALAGAVLGHLVGPCALAALQHNGIVAHMHITPSDDNVAADIQIDGIRAGCTVLTAGEVEYAACRCIDKAVQIANALAVVEMVGPEGRVDGAHTLYGDVARI